MLSRPLRIRIARRAFEKVPKILMPAALAPRISEVGDLLEAQALAFCESSL